MSDKFDILLSIIKSSEKFNGHYQFSCSGLQLGLLIEFSRYLDTKFEDCWFELRLNNHLNNVNATIYMISDNGEKLFGTFDDLNISTTLP